MCQEWRASFCISRDGGSWAAVRRENEQQDGGVALTADVLCPATTACHGGGYWEPGGVSNGGFCGIPKDWCEFGHFRGKIHQGVISFKYHKVINVLPFLLNCPCPTPFSQHLHHQDLVWKLPDTLPLGRKCSHTLHPLL